MSPALDPACVRREQLLIRPMAQTFDDLFPVDIDLPWSDYERFGSHFHVEVPAKRIPNGRILWINDNWFLSHGLDLSDAHIRRLVENWLKDSLCLQTTSAIDGTTSIYVKADRYGGTGGTAHGGSGRCIYRGRFNVKGVGRTQLVSNGALNHSDGRLGLVEAMRGAIYGEVIGAETIGGSVPTVAILALPPFDGPVNRRPCLAVRPNFIRPAHGERSLFFGTSGYKGSDQYEDNLRVMGVRSVLAEMAIDWSDIASRCAAQIGSLDAIRVAQGRFTSSNMSIFGAVADFDTFRVFDTWSYLDSPRRSGHLFGREVEDLAAAARAWAWRLGGIRIARGEIDGLVRHSHRSGFEKTLNHVVPGWEGKRAVPQSELCSRIWTMFDASRHGRRCDADWLVSPDPPGRTYLAEATSLAASVGFDNREALCVAGRLNFWRRRTGAGFESINSAWGAFAAGQALEPSAVATWTATQIKSARRLYADLDDWLVPLSGLRAEPASVIAFDARHGLFCIVDQRSAPVASPRMTLGSLDGLASFLRAEQRTVEPAQNVLAVGQALDALG